MSNRPLASVGIGTEEEPVGRLLVAERIGPETLERWGELCGARVVLGPVAGSARPAPDPDSLQHGVRGLTGGELRVESKLDAERTARGRVVDRSAVCTTQAALAHASARAGRAADRDARL